MNRNNKSALGLFSIILNINFIFIILAIIWGIAKKEPSMKFQEYGFITKFSALQLFIIGIVCFRSFQNTKKIIWLLIALGFSFLALDELFLIHENLDQWIHNIFNLEKTKWTDKIDDFIILFYGIIGAIFMTGNYRVFIKNKPGLLITATGFLLMVLSVIIDTTTNDTLVFSTKLIDGDIQYHIAAIIEESFKIISEGTLLTGFITYLKS
ncbi:hypothetical protein [Carboxylicivirga linearis]|uniref:Uncharacterized protein n=1 Tax=Carboxylicivirga linearis TaxID=1628157 RepID=A0ABS5JW87_9BACT|nr:hypothetical protein [Carboxylicivirga linearis]MBS2099113.1 hypothetical protein [Carboxylicivirga linearis]